MNCERCGHPHTQAEWDELQKDWQTFFQTKKGFSLQKAFDAAHREMRKHGPRPNGPAKPPLWLRLATKLMGEGESMKKVWNWFNGKKTLIGSILIGVPVIWMEVEKILQTGGVEETTLVAIGGGIALAVGWGHKLMKVLGLAAQPE